MRPPGPSFLEGFGPWCCPSRSSRLEAARKLTSSGEILLWKTPSEAPEALQAPECSELLDPMRASCWIFAQHEPGKFAWGCVATLPGDAAHVRVARESCGETSGYQPLLGVMMARPQPAGKDAMLSGSGRMALQTLQRGEARAANAAQPSAESGHVQRWGSESPAKIAGVTLMHVFHGNL